MAAIDGLSSLLLGNLKPKKKGGFRLAGPKVKCVVDTCTHYLPGNLCGAYNIDIMHEEEGHMSEIREQTMCKTFSHRTGIAQMLGSLDNVNWGGALGNLLIPDYNLKPSVTCTVASCKYWGEGSICVANGIEITGAGSNECQDTNCETFERRS
jgi:hypothetical protein